eukprot:7624166-Ditylum_brightwellii.AAC.1
MVSICGGSVLFGMSPCRTFNVVSSMPLMLFGSKLLLTNCFVASVSSASPKIPVSGAVVKGVPCA